MAGVPLTLGFVGKDGAYEALLHGERTGFAWLLVLIVVASSLLGLAGLLAGVLPFRGDVPSITEAHEPAWPLWLPPLVLAVTGLLAGVAPSILNGPLSSAATAIVGVPADVSFAVWHGLTPALMLSVLTLAARRMCVHAARGRADADVARHAAGRSDLYNGMLAALDTVSRAIGPPLHSASLRSYVMVIVVHRDRWWAALRSSPIRVWVQQSRAPVSTSTKCSSSSSSSPVRSRRRGASTMAAVLSLGVVGYGVAMMFLALARRISR